MHGGCCIVGVDSMSCCLGKINLYSLIVNIMINSTCSIAASAHTGDEIIGIIATHLFLQLPFQFLGDDTLHLCHNVWIRMRTHGASYDIESILWMTAPVTYSLRTGITQGHVARAHRIHLGTQHLHTLHIGVLTLHICSTHKDFALHIHQGTDGGCCHTVLTGSCLCDDTGLAHLLCHQNLTDGIVDLVCSCMVQVLTLQIELATIFLAHAFGIIER